MARSIDPTAYLRAAAQLQSVRQKIIANNIANIDTPGYQRKEVSFQQHLTRAIESGTTEALQNINPEIATPQNTPVKANGNNVEIEREIGDMVDSSIRYKLYIRLQKKIGSQKRLAIDTQA